MGKGFFMGVVLLLGLAQAGQAADKAPSREGKKHHTAEEARYVAACGNLQVEMEVEYLDMSGSASFLVADTSQFNQVIGGEKRLGAAEGKDGRAEFKKYGFVFNAVPACDPGKADEVAMEFQIELSSPAADGSDMRSWQVQSRLVFKKGQKTLVVAKPARLVITVSDAGEPSL